ncbi:unnamed protein product [Durusdinium trenchii]|uniref:Peptidase E n=2 Tax=Durusdinium trenchii TaxID=1381693 RepID=A0ABP0R0R1_9DINO
MRFFLSGSGSTAAMASLSYCERVVRLTRKPPHELHLAYLGTPMYDLERFRVKLLTPFLQLGVTCHPIDLVETQRLSEEHRAWLLKSDIILVSGGNTLYAMDLWKATGVAELLAEVKDTAVFCGGSAGANCWFDGGHSDSMDPMTFRKSMAPSSGELSEFDGPSKSWEYIRIEGLGFLPGLCCPHHDRVQSNGVLRAEDFEKLLRRHPQERGICIDDWAALEIDGESYQIFVAPDAPKSAKVFIKEIDGGTLQATGVPMEGKLHELLRRASAITQDERQELCRVLNPIG